MSGIGVNYLRSLRNRKGKTLREVASECGFSVSALCKIECGTTSISKDFAEKLSKYYGVSIEPVKIITSFEKPTLEKAPHYKVLNDKLKEENKRLKQQIDDLTKAIEKHKNNMLEICNILEKYKEL